MTAVTVDAVLERAAEIMRDPSRVVLDVDNLFEDAEGNPVWDAEPAQRCCFTGAFRLAAMGLSGDPYSDIAEEARDATAREFGGGWTKYLRDEGPEACAAVIDRAREAR